MSEELEQPQLDCPSCGQSLRGLEPLPPALLLRCPECGTVTSITQLAADFTQRQKDIRRLPLLVLQSVIIAGLVLAIEPMVNAGSHEIEVLEDQWTAVTKDRRLSAHFEHSVAITENGPVVLSRSVAS